LVRCRLRVGLGSRLCIQHLKRRPKLVLRRGFCVPQMLNAEM
jgi:hypothetical protein